MKVLHVYHTYYPDPPGGVAEVIRQIAISTSNHGIYSKVFALSENPIPNKILVDDIEVTRSRSWFSPASCDIGGIDSIKRFQSLIDWADVINFHFPWPFFDILRLICNSRKPSVLTYHSDIVRQKFFSYLYKPLMIRTLRSMSSVVATSPTYVATSDVLKKYVADEQLSIIPLGINDFSNTPIDKSLEDEFLNRHGIKDKHYVLYLGALRYYKGLHTLVQSAPDVQGTIVIAGSGPQEALLKRIAAERSISNLLFLGMVSNQEKAILMKNCTAFVLPSHLRSEAFGMVLVEASMFGKPMVTCEIGTGTTFVNQHNNTGFAVPPESPILLANALNKFLQDSTLAFDMGQAARLRYEEFFSGEALGAKYSNLYSELVSVKK